nr:hypothetical protein [Mycoplasmopsis bovis]
MILVTDHTDSRITTINEIAPSHDIKVATNAQSKPTYKLVAILLLLLHRIPEGFLIGFIISGIENKGITSTSVAFLISLILHLIPEQVLFLLPSKRNRLK